MGDVGRSGDDGVLVELAEQVRPAHTALVLVDVQNDFLHPEGVLATAALSGFLDFSMVPGMVTQTRALLAAARQAGVWCVFVQMLGDAVYQSAPTKALHRRRSGAGGGDGGRAVLEGTWGADFYDDIRPDPAGSDLVVHKYRYSAFAGTNLDLVLRSHDIKTLVMCGDATSGCVESTTRDGFFADYYVVTAGDACADFDLERHRASLRKMDLSFGYVTTVGQLAALWAPAAGPRPTEGDHRAHATAAASG
jgi:ureidoacrylate peracid hydrolase